MSVSTRAELMTERMITDIGPGCPDCGSADGTGMWLYLVPSEGDWTIVVRCRDGLGSVMAVCACCHRGEYFDVYPEDTTHIRNVRAVHLATRNVGRIYSVTSGRK